MKIIEAYHGTNVRFHRFDQNKARLANDFYGGGVAYFTDSVEIAKSYARSMYNRNKVDGKFVYSVSLSMSKTFDVDDKFEGDELIKIIGSMNLDQFARSAKLLKLREDKLKTISKLRNGGIVLTGDQLFRGLSNGMINTAEARHRLIRCGYDSLRYNGGLNMNTSKHNVYLMYNANDIIIKNRYIVSDRNVSNNERLETYSYI